MARPVVAIVGRPNVGKVHSLISLSENVFQSSTIHLA